MSEHVALAPAGPRAQLDRRTDGTKATEPSGGALPRGLGIGIGIEGKDDVDIEIGHDVGIEIDGDYDAEDDIDEQTYGSKLRKSTIRAALGLESLPGLPYQLPRARVMDPTVGRFTSVDPLGLDAGDHRFIYANNEPTGLVDPGGMKFGAGYTVIDWSGFKRFQSNRTFEGMERAEFEAKYAAAEQAYKASYAEFQAATVAAVVAAAESDPGAGGGEAVGGASTELEWGDPGGAAKYRGNEGWVWEDTSTTAETASAPPPTRPPDLEGGLGYVPTSNSLFTALEEQSATSGEKSVVEKSNANFARAGATLPPDWENQRPWEVNNVGEWQRCSHLSHFVLTPVDHKITADSALLNYLYPAVGYAEALAAGTVRSGGNLLVFVANPELLWQAPEVLVGVDRRLKRSTNPYLEHALGIDPGSKYAYAMGPIASDWLIGLAGGAAAEFAEHAAGVARVGGALPVRIGQAGEASVRAAQDIGPKIKIRVGGRVRIPDGLTGSVLTEVKNVGSLSYTRQLRDFAAHAGRNGLRFDLWVRPNTQLSGPLAQEVAKGTINLRFIP